MEKMSFVSRETANASNIFNEMLKDLGLIKRSLRFFESPDLVGTNWDYTNENGDSIIAGPFTV